MSVVSASTTEVEGVADEPRSILDARSPGKLVEAASPQVAIPQHITMTDMR